MNIPDIGLGTYRLKGQQVIDSVTNGLEIGYRHIDTAQIYGNEAEVGLAVANSRIARADLFITTKIWVDNFSRAALIPSLQQSFEKLRIDKVDLTLIHWPSPGEAVPLAEYLGALAEAKAQGLTSMIGVSNFNNGLLQQAIDLLGPGEIATNQVEIHPFLQNKKVVEFARHHNIHITAYMPLAYGKVINNPVIEKIARDHQVTPAQIALAWSLQQGFAVIPSSTKRSNLESNFHVRGIVLTEAEMRQIETLEANDRLANPQSLVPVWD